MNPLDAELEEFGTVRNFFRKALLAFWEEQVGFDGKRPFGNSGWSVDLIQAVAAQQGMEWDEYHEDIIGLDYHGDDWWRIDREITAALEEWLS